jgi:hypothetical protein
MRKLFSTAASPHEREVPWPPVGQQSLDTKMSGDTKVAGRIGLKKNILSKNWIQGHVGLIQKAGSNCIMGNYAEIFKWNELGRMKPYCQGDIIVVSKSLLDNIKNLKDISLVLFNGKVLGRDKLLRP